MAQPGLVRRPLMISDNDRCARERIARRRISARFMARCARIVPRCRDGGSDARAARGPGIRPRTVRTWRDRYIDGGLDSLSGEERPGRPRDPEH
ncbi:helix-turn-helix domain-containing protein [Marinactinospora rubrisoli]|uniref:Helix-turn-helix domain-containing protein n=1 Tax=Marinactinospora rubrisoli TaxID=2715399 RepID=A0ABW2KAE0_9ACTN